MATVELNTRQARVLLNSRSYVLYQYVDVAQTQTLSQLAINGMMLLNLTV